MRAGERVVLGTGLRNMSFEADLLLAIDADKMDAVQIGPMLRAPAACALSRATRIAAFWSASSPRTSSSLWLARSSTAFISAASA